VCSKFYILIDNFAWSSFQGKTKFRNLVGILWFLFVFCFLFFISKHSLW
jgi:hypothetical protein